MTDTITPEQYRARPRHKLDPVFAAFLDEYRVPRPVCEHKFHPVRRWRFDYAWLGHRVAVEVEGGLFKGGGSRHNRGAGMRADMEKYNAATVLGWRVFRVLPEQLCTKYTADLLTPTLAPGGAKSD